jgi:hypothetical protein
MDTIKLVAGYMLAAIVAIYAISLVFVGACLLDTSVAVESCRNNAAGELVFYTLSLFTR